MNQFRDNYFKARDIIAQELKQKYKLTESYKDENNLSLDFFNFSLEITFFIPEGIDINISNHKNEFYNDSFMGLVLKKYPNIKEMGIKLKSLFKTKDHFDSDFSFIYSSLSNKIKFVENEYAELFKTS